jgi:hypothetical protein
MNRAVLVLVTGLCFIALKPVSAQQAAGAAPVAGVSPAPVSSSRSGPRLQPEFRRFEASVSDSSTAARASTVNYSGGGVTITLSTLALVLVVVIIVLLVAR